MIEHGGEHGFIHPARTRESAVAVDCLAGMLKRPIVKRRIARPRVERDQLALGPDIGDIRDTADIHHRQRQLHVSREHQMVERHERRPLPARGDIGKPKFVHHGNAGRARKLCPVADLPGAPVRRTMQDGLSVETDHGDVGGLQPRFKQQRGNRIRMGVGQEPLGLLDFWRGGRALRHWRPRRNGRPRRHASRHLQRFMQHGARRGMIGTCQRGARHGDCFPVGVEDRGVDPVERGSAHQPDHFKNVRHSCYPGRPLSPRLTE